MLAERGRPPIGRAVLSQMVGKGSEHLVQLALAHAGLPPADAPAIVATSPDADARPEVLVRVRLSLHRRHDTTTHRLLAGNGGASHATFSEMRAYSE